MLLAAALLSGICASILFLSTGRPIPRSVEPLDEFENRPPIRISDCGQFGIKPVGKREGLGLRQELEIWQLWPRLKISTILCEDGECTNLTLNPARTLVAISGISFCEVKRWPGGEAVCKGKYLGGTNPNILVFSKDGTRLIICTEDYAARVIDATTGKRIGWFLDLFDHAKGSGPSTIACYFDASDQPKGVIDDDDGLTVWDIVTQRPQFRLHDRSGAQVFSPLASEPIEGLRNCLISPDSTSIATGHQDGRMRLWSLEDGSLIREVKVASSGSCYPIQFTTNGRYLALLRIPDTRLPDWASKLPDSWREYVQKLLMGQAGTTVVDLQTGTSWTGFPATGLCVFADGGSTFLTWDKELVIWDFPPKWQYFTPWAWAALASCILFGCLWRMTRQRSMAKPTRTGVT